MEWVEGEEGQHRNRCGMYLLCKLSRGAQHQCPGALGARHAAVALLVLLQELQEGAPQSSTRQGHAHVYCLLV